MTTSNAFSYDSYDDSSAEARDRIRQIDRLVDGELGPSERRELLLDLEHRSDGWRQCALAFLEAQSFADGFRSITLDPPPEDLSGAVYHGDAAVNIARPSHVEVADQAPRATRWTSVMATAAGLMIAFSIGIAARGIWSASHDAPPLATRSTEPEPRALATTTPPTLLPTAVPPQTTTVSKVSVPFADRSGGRLEDVIVPVVNADSAKPFLSGAQRQLPPDVLRMLEQFGTLERSHGFLPARLGDGRRVVIPLERINVRSETPAYQ